MVKQRSLDKETRKELKEYINARGVISVDELKEEVKPHLIYKSDDLVDKLARKVARGLIAAARDDQGIRTCFSTLQDGLFINIDRSIDLSALRKVNKQLKDKRNGLNASIRKSSLRIKQMEGQISFFDDDIEMKKSKQSTNL
jgi:ABC-type phosphate transport system auxiliary subunit